MAVMAAQQLNVLSVAEPASKNSSNVNFCDAYLDEHTH